MGGLVLSVFRIYGSSTDGGGPVEAECFSKRGI